MNKKTDVCMAGVAIQYAPPYENVHVGFFIPTSRKRKKSTVNSYNLILYHFHTKSKGKQP